MILEALVTTINADGTLNIAPMGPVVSDAMGRDFQLDRFDLKPFETSTTHANLLRTSCGVLHVTDNVEMIAAAAVGALREDEVETTAASAIDGRIIADACRWYEFVVDFVDQSSTRGVFKCRPVGAGRTRDFFGFNRAMHAVLEGAILSTRIDFLPAAGIAEQFERLQIIVEKTGGEREKRAFRLLEEFIASHVAEQRATS